MSFLLAIVLVSLHGPSGARVDINAAEVTSINEIHGQTENFVKGTHCVVVMSNGRFIGVREECDEVRDKMRGSAVVQAPCTWVCGEAPRRY